MEEKKIKAIIEAILFAAGRQVTIKELVLSLEIEQKEIENLINEMQEEYKAEVGQKLEAPMPVKGGSRE